MLIDSQLYTKGDKFQMIAQLYRASEASIAPMLLCRSIKNERGRDREGERKEARKSERCFHFIHRFCVHSSPSLFHLLCHATTQFGIICAENTKNTNSNAIRNIEVRKVASLRMMDTNTKITNRRNICVVRFSDTFLLC